MLTVNRFETILRKEFYLDSDDVTIRRKVDGWGNKYQVGDIVIPYKLCTKKNCLYGGIHIPKTRTSVLYHHLLTLLRNIPIPDTCVVDHLDGDTTNNTRSNIRIISQKFNARNQRKHRNNTSGHSGINWNKQANLYYIRKRVDGKRLYKSSKTLEEALVLKKQMDLVGFSYGYTARHGE